jgi:hypothetical protein
MLRRERRFGRVCRGGYRLFVCAQGKYKKGCDYDGGKTAQNEIETGGVRVFLFVHEKPFCLFGDGEINANGWRAVYLRAALFTAGIFARRI